MIQGGEDGRPKTPAPMIRMELILDCCLVDWAVDCRGVMLSLWTVV